MNWGSWQKYASEVKQNMDDEEILCQLAEEAAELGHAALKFRRTLSDKNPTTKTREKALAALAEEIADVSNCIGLLGDIIDDKTTRLIALRKMKRWAQRLKGGKKK